MDLIDRDKLDSFKFRSASERMDLPVDYMVGWNDAVDGIMCNAPAVDAEPVRHGHWIDIDSETYTWAIRCNKCGHERSMMSTQKTYPNYCEKCGAKMDERTEE